MISKFSICLVSLCALSSNAMAAGVKAESPLNAAEQLCWAKVSQTMRFIKAPSLDEQRQMIQPCMNAKPMDVKKEFVMPAPLPSQEYGY